MTDDDVNSGVILVAIDGSASANAAMRAALELAATTGNRLLFVTAWRELRGDFGIPLHRLLPELVEVERDWAAKTLEEAAAEAQAVGVDAETISRHGFPAQEICAVARERRPRMIVVGSHGWGSISGALFGSVSTGVLHHAPCPVLVVPEPTDLSNGSARRESDMPAPVTLR
jgi:nucleotide-binding universal stress UspA family protein